jgi:hypothetical protein
VIKAIETHYAGYRFRSRLEARWAVFFDHLKIEWQYEPQGYEVASVNTDKTWAYLPDFYLPGFETWVEVKGDFGQFDWDMVANVIDWGGALPGVEDSLDTTRGLLILGPIPEAPCGFLPAHPILQHRKGGSVRTATFGFKEVAVCADSPGADDYFDASWGNPERPDGWVQLIEKHFGGGWGYHKVKPHVYEAYQRARKARFEHGEHG